MNTAEIREKMLEYKHRYHTMESFLAGHPVEVRYSGCDDWYREHNPTWNWQYCDYRIAGRDGEVVTEGGRTGKRFAILGGTGIRWDNGEIEYR